MLDGLKEEQQGSTIGKRAGSDNTKQIMEAGREFRTRKMIKMFQDQDMRC